MIDFSRSPWACMILGGLLAAGLVLGGCGSSQATTGRAPSSSSDSSKIVFKQKNSGSEPPADSASSGEPPEGRETTAPKQKKVLRPSNVAAQIDEAAQDWYGVPYQWGGESKNGVDCSAFVQNVYREAFSYQLPRVTETQVQTGTEVPRSQVRAGDLVFFKPEGEWNHVGVYLGDNTFAHASSSNGVTRDSFDASYWSRYYWTARRPLRPSVIPDSLTSELVAYRSPGAASDTSTARADPTDEQTSESQDKMITIASCSDADVECAPSDGSDGNSSASERAVAAADTTTRKGW